MINISIPLIDYFESIENLDSLLLIIENKKLLYKFLKDIGSGCVYEEYIQLYDENNKRIKNNDYIDFVPSILDIDINNKKNINALIKFIKKMCYDEIKETSKNIELLLKHSFNSLKLDIPLDIIDDIDISEEDYFKLINVKIVDNDISLLERINNYIKTSFELRSMKVFVFYGLYSLLDEDEVSSLIKDCQYLNVKLIDIENTEILSKCFSNKIILDKDICLLK